MNERVLSSEMDTRILLQDARSRGQERPLSSADTLEPAIFSDNKNEPSRSSSLEADAPTIQQRGPQLENRTGSVHQSPTSKDQEPVQGIHIVKSLNASEYAIEYVNPRYIVIA